MKKLNIHSIAVKVFFLTAISLITILALFVVGQNLFYGKIYTSNRDKLLNNAVESFATEIDGIQDASELKNSISTAAMDSDVYLMVIEDDKPIWGSYEIEIEDEAGEKSKITVDNAVRDKSFFDLRLSKGETVKVKCMQRSNNGEMFLIAIEKDNGLKWEEDRMSMEGQAPPEKPDMDKAPKGTPPAKPGNDLIEYTGTVSALVLPSIDYRGTAQRSDALNAAWEWTNDKSKTQYHYSGESEEYTVKVKQVSDNRYVFGMISLKNIDEAVSAMKGLMIPLFIISVIIALIISLFVSGNVTRPILHISRVTSKMASFDFEARCNVKQKNELGILADNVNLMSDELAGKITELEEKNELLRQDIDHERMLEQQRKEFVATVSHELKTPLGIIRAYAEGIRDGISKDKTEKYINTIVDETSKMDRLVLDMLENSKLEAGKEELVLGEYDLVKIADKYVKLFDAEVKRKNVTFECSLPEIAMAIFDCDRIEHVVENFFSNAVKNVFEGGKIYITIEEHPNTVSLSVENDGKHIPEDEINNVWDRFYKVDKARGRTGTGLGLSIAKNILKLHKADYNVENTEKGVKFSFFLQKVLDK